MSDFEVFSALGPYAIAFSTLCVGLIARATFRNWKAQQRAQKQAEVAEEALSVMYEADVVFRVIRSPLTHHTMEELRRDKEGESPSSETRKRLETIERFEGFFERNAKILSTVKIYFGEQPYSDISLPLRIRNEILLAIQFYEELLVDEKDGISNETRDLIKQQRQIFSGRFSDRDETHTKLIYATNRVENILIPIARYENEKSFFQRVIGN